MPVSGVAMRASATVPLEMFVPFSAVRFTPEAAGSVAGKRASGTVPEPRFVAFNAVKLTPESAGNVAPVSVSAEAVTVIFAEPLNEVPLIVRAVCSVVAVPALPVTVVWSPVFVPLKLEPVTAPEAVTVAALTVPVNVGDASGALRSSAVCCAVETGLFASLVFVTLPSPTCAAVMPVGVPVKAGEASGALSASAAVVVLATAAASAVAPCAAVA